jgi:hypothetical protein
LSTSNNTPESGYNSTQLDEKCKLFCVVPFPCLFTAFFSHSMCVLFAGTFTWMKVMQDTQYDGICSCCVAAEANEVDLEHRYLSVSRMCTTFSCSFSVDAEAVGL